MAEQRADMGLVVRDEDTKLVTLVEILGTKKVLTAKDQKKIFGLPPFARA